jgi:hypothetical protein
MAKIGKINRKPLPLSLGPIPLRAAQPSLLPPSSLSSWAGSAPCDPTAFFPLASLRFSFFSTDFSCAGPPDFLPARPSWAPPAPPRFPPLGPVARGPPERALFFFGAAQLLLPSAAARSAGSCLRAAYSRHAWRDGSAAMQSGGRFSNFRPRISRPHRENRP